MKLATSLAVAATALVLGACSSSNNGQNRPGTTITLDDIATVQVLHASPDAPPVNVFVDGSEALSNVDYGTASAFITVSAGIHEIRVEGILPGGNVDVIGPVDLQFDKQKIYTISAVGSVANIQASVIEQPIAPVSADSARLFVLHATPGPMDSLPVDVYVTTPGADLSMTAPTGTFDFTETLGPVEVPAGDYQIRVTLAGDSAAVAYDSGTVTLSDGLDLRVAAVPNTSGGPAAVTLLGLASTGAIEFLDVNTPTGLRIGHLSPTAGPVDVFVNDAEYLADVPFGVVTGFDIIPADTYNVAVTPANSPGVFAIGPVDLALDAGTYYSVLAVDGAMGVEPLILTDDPRPQALSAKVRIVHASPTAQDVDIYVTAPGADISMLEPLLADVPYLANTGYLQLAEGDYEVTVTPAGTKDAAIGPAPLSVAGGDVFTAIARDPLAGEMAFGLIVSSDSIVEDD